MTKPWAALCSLLPVAIAMTVGTAMPPCSGQTETKSTTKAPSQQKQQRSDKTEAPSSLSKYDLGPYKNDLRRRVMRNYYPPKCSSPGTAKVTVHISNTGAILSSKLTTSSSCPLYDRCALDAIERVGLFRPLPDGLAAISAEITFDYQLLLNGKAIKLTDVIATKSASIPKTVSANFLTASRTIPQLTAALRAADFDGAQMNVAGLGNEGTDMVVRLIFKQVEMAAESNGKDAGQNIDDIIYKTAYLAHSETTEISKLTAPIIATLNSDERRSIKTDKVFLSRLATLFDKLDELTKRVEIPRGPSRSY
ncbi:MAG: TonB family protein [Candidatus Obscuribacter sp.]|nr:TonB family protein [Candidatus Obscuribacter sp.]